MFVFNDVRFSICIVFMLSLLLLNVLIAPPVYVLIDRLWAEAESFYLNQQHSQRYPPELGTLPS